MAAPRKQRLDESWKDYATYLYNNFELTAAEIARRLNKNKTVVYYHLNPEFRRDRVIQNRIRRARMTEKEREEELIAKRHRKSAGRHRYWHFGSPEHEEHLKRLSAAGAAARRKRREGNGSISQVN